MPSVSLLPLEELIMEDPIVRKQRHHTLLRDVEKKVYQSEWFHSRPHRVQELFRAYPPWGFYVLRDTDIPVRHYGIIEYVDGTLGFHAHIAQSHWTTKVVGGIPEGRIERVPWWNEEQLQYIEKNDFPRAFLEPLGFMVFHPHQV